MTIASLVILLIVAGVCGAVGQAIAGYSLGGFLVSIGVGFIGALLGVWLSAGLGLPEMFALNIGGRNFPIVWAILGSSLFVALIALMRRGSWRRAY